MSELLADIITYIRDAGGIGVAMFAVAYVAATVLFLPGSILAIGAGFAYGLPGVAVVLPSALLGAVIAFLLGRGIARSWLERRIAGHPRFMAVDEAIGEDGLRVVFLLRLSPLIPFSLLNYALGLSRVRVRDFVIASATGMIPGTFLYVYLGLLITSVAELAGGNVPSTGIWGQVAFWGGLVATVLATVTITRVARRRLDEVIDKTPGSRRVPVR